MSALPQALFKYLPEQTKSTKSDFNLKPAAVDQWFDNLLLANIRVSTKDIYNAIKATNSLSCHYKKRLYFLEKLHEPVVDLAHNLRKLNLNRELPPGEKNQRIAILNRKMHEQISIAYKLVLKDLLNCKLFFLCPGRNKLMAQVIERIMRHNSLALISSYQLYQPPHKGLWSDIHKLFLMASKEKLLNKKITDPTLLLITETTIKEIYLQILLVAVADPFRMPQHHIYSIFRQLEEWAPLANIRPYKEDDSRDNLFINLSADKHPTFINPKDADKKANIWVLDTSKLDYAHLLEHFNNIETQTTEINGNILKQLSLAWGIVPNREHSRRPAKSKLKVAIGLNNVHYVLNGYSDPEWLNNDNDTDEAETGLQLTDDLVDSEANFHSRTVESTVKVNDIWGEVFTSKTLLNTAEQSSILNDTSTDRATDSRNPKYWNMINESIGGYCLLWDQQGSVNAKVGEIIAVSNNEDKKEGYWFIGTIRWIKCDKSSRIQIGVQVLAPNAIAVSTARYSSMQEGIKSRAILLPAIPVLNQPKTLLTTGLGYEVRDQVILYEYRLVNANITSVKTKVVLIDTLDVTPHFARFKYQSAEEFYGTGNKPAASLEEQKDDTLSLDGDSEFDSIWDDL